MNISFPCRIMFKRKNIKSDILIPDNLIGHLIGNPFYCPDFIITLNKEVLTLTPTPLVGKLWKNKTTNEDDNVNININNIKEIHLKNRMIVNQVYILLTSEEELFINIKESNKNIVKQTIEYINKNKGD